MLRFNEKIFMRSGYREYTLALDNFNFLGALVATLHLLSLILLFRFEEDNVNGSQKYLLTF